MREIKFRVWDKKEKKLYYPGTYCDRSDNEEWYGSSLSMKLQGITSLSNDNNFELMQYTGLKDENGIDIFEGDILGYDEGQIKGGQTTFCQFVVKFGKYSCGCGDYYCNEDGYGFYLSGYNGYHRSNGTSDKYEYDRRFGAYPVIGNIYENQDLLTK